MDKVIDIKNLTLEDMYELADKEDCHAIVENGKVIDIIKPKKS